MTEKRKNFTAKVKWEAWQRCKGKCEKCLSRLTPGRFQYDHVIPDGLGGLPTLDNCEVLCSACHDPKTREKDVPAIAKSKRIRRREAGIKKDRKITKWRRFNGSIVEAPRER
jgi:5-methylcytosine-specific restriction protein A